MKRLLRGILRVPFAVWFLAYFLAELIMANALVAWEVMTPNYNMRPGIIRVPIRSRSPTEITLLANFISLTPGTLSLEVGDSVLFVHALHVSTPDRLRARIHRLEDRLLEVLR